MNPNQDLETSPQPVNLHQPKKIQKIWNLFQNQNLFAKISVLFLAIITLVTPVFLAKQHNLNSHASNGLPSNCIQAPSCVKNGSCPNLINAKGVNWCNQSTLTVISNPDIVSSNAIVTASNTYQNFVPQNVISNTSSYWNSGQYAKPSNPQWVLLQLKYPSTISEIKLNVAQSPQGQTIHNVYVGESLQKLSLIKQFQGITYSGEVLDVTFPSVLKNITYIKVETTQSPSWTAWNKITVYGTITPHFQYFGYYWGINRIDYNHINANVMVISNTDSGTVSKIAQEDIDSLQYLQKRHMKGILSVDRVFFDTQTYTLLPDWEQRWNSYWKLLYPYLSDIYAFYPIDEPDLHIASTTLETLAHIIKINVDTTHYSIPVLTVFSPSGVLKIQSNTYNIPADVGLIGFDEYGCTDNCFGGISFAQKYSILEQIAKQRGIGTIMIGDGLKGGTSIPSSTEQSAWIDRNKNRIALCTSSQPCRAYLVFLFDSFPQIQGGLIGVNQMPVLYNYLQDAAMSILKAN